MVIYVTFHKFANGQGKILAIRAMSDTDGLVSAPGITRSWFRIKIDRIAGSYERGCYTPRCETQPSLRGKAKMIPAQKINREIVAAL